MQRRTVLKLGIASGAALMLAGGGAVLFYERAWQDGHLTSTGRLVFAAVARAVLDGSLPREADASQAALASHLDRVDATLGAMSPAAQRDVSTLLTILATPLGRIAFAGVTSDWRRADVPQIQAALQGMRSSRLMLRRQAYHALRDLTHAAYFADSSTWRQLGYTGPVKIQ